MLAPADGFTWWHHWHIRWVEGKGEKLSLATRLPSQWPPFKTTLCVEAWKHCIISTLVSVTLLDIFKETQTSPAVSADTRAGSLTTTGSFPFSEVFLVPKPSKVIRTFIMDFTLRDRYVTVVMQASCYWSQLEDDEKLQKPQVKCESFTLKYTDRVK